MFKGTMFVQLLTYTPDPEQVVASAAKLCYSASSIGHLLEKSRVERENLLKKILSLGHLSVLEHASFTFGIEGISRACSHQLVRHRLASFAQQSQRYVSQKECFAAVIPPSIADRPELKERYEALLKQVHQVYRELLDGGIPAEDARFVLPNGAETKLVLTMNARELLHFFNLRCCRRAQWEIRSVAKEMVRLVRQVAPIIFSGAGPACLKGPCPEGTMTCGAMAEVRREYAEL
jgi:thymidylate synthase (FAD)